MISGPAQLRPIVTGALATLALVGLVGFGAGACNRHGQGKADTGTTPGSSRDADEGGEAERPERVEIDVFAFGRQLGTIAPCGCTTEPLGGLQYVFGYIEEESEAGERLILEPGSFLYPDPEGPEAPADEAAWAQAQQRADLLHGRFSQFDGLVSGLGPTDYASSKAAAALKEHPLPRVIANLAPRGGESEGENPDKDGPAGVETHRVVELGHGISAAVTQVVDPELAEAARAAGWAAEFPALEDPIAALKALAPKLEAAGQLQVVMVHGPRALAERVAREIEGVEIVVMAGVLDNPDRARLGSSPVYIDGTWLLEPGDRAQTVSHLTLSLDPELPAGELPGDWQLIDSPDKIREQLAGVEADLAKYADDPEADASFIATLEQKRDTLKAQLEDPSIPADVKVAVIPSQTRITCHLPGDETAKAALDEYDAWVAKQNQARFAGVEAPKPEPGEPGYAGIEACNDCHEEAVEFWKTTVHAGAYETLVVDNKQFDLSCVNCHVTGFRKPGGSEVVENHDLRDIQCEQCHGPGSLHVEDPSTDNITLEAPSSVCLECHTPEHSDTFDYEPYLRDVLGEGHGADARAALGDGPTGRELRKAGLEKAGGGCKKM